VIKGRGAYDVDLDIADRYGRYECVGLAVRAPHGGRVDGDLLRRLRVADLVRATAAELEDSGLADAAAKTLENAGAPPDNAAAGSQEWREWHNREIAQPARAEAARYRRMVKEAAQAGGVTRLKAAAVIYKRAVRNQRPPTRAVEKELHITRAAAIGLVRRCRELEPPLLPKTSKGVASASAPPKRKRNR
jgi:hypothetical protein